MNSEICSTQPESSNVSSISAEQKNQLFEMAYIHLRHAGSRLSMQKLMGMNANALIAGLKGVIAILKPFNQLDQSNILSDNETVAEIRSHYYKYAMGGKSDCEQFIYDGLNNGTPECFVNLMILEACANFVLADIFKVKWGLIRKMHFGAKLDYIRVRYQLISEFMKTIK